MHELVTDLDGVARALHEFVGEDVLLLSALRVRGLGVLLESQADVVVNELVAGAAVVGESLAAGQEPELAESGAAGDEYLSIVERVTEVYLAAALVCVEVGELRVYGLAEEEFGAGVDGEAEEIVAEVGEACPVILRGGLRGGEGFVQMLIVALFEVDVGDLFAGKVRT